MYESHFNYSTRKDRSLVRCRLARSPARAARRRAGSCLVWHSVKARNTCMRVDATRRADVQLSDREFTGLRVNLEPGPSALRWLLGDDVADRAWGRLKITSQFWAGYF